MTEKLKKFFETKSVKDFMNKETINITENIILQLENLLSRYNRISDVSSSRREIVFNLMRYNVKDNWFMLLERSRGLGYNAASLNVYIARYGDDIGQMLFNKKCEESVATKEKYLQNHTNEEWEQLCNKKKSVGLENMINRYGQEKGQKRWKEYLQKWHAGIERRKLQGPWKTGLTLEEFQQKHGREEGFRRWCAKSAKRRHTLSLQGFIERFGDVAGPEKYKQYCAEKDHTSLKALIAKYGEDDGRKRYAAICLQHAENSSKNVITYSKISQELFWNIYDHLDDDSRGMTYFAELNEEIVFYFENIDCIKIATVDFKLGEKIIEFDGDYWHSSNDAKWKDIKRDVALESKGYKILRIKERDYRENKQKELKKCLVFLIAGD